MGDQFNSSTQQDVKAGGDGKKLFDWRVLNAANAAAIDVNITNAGMLTISSTSNAADPWTENPLTAVIVYQLVTGDFDVETNFTAAANPSAPRCGMICRNPNIASGENWIELIWVSGNGNMARAAVNTSPSQVTTGLNNAYIRMTRAGNVISLYHKATSGAGWTQITQYTRNDMPQVVQLGLFGAQAMTAQFDYFQGTYSIAKTRIPHFASCSVASEYDYACPSAIVETLEEYNVSPLMDGPFTLELYIQTVLASVFIELIDVVYAIQWPQVIKQPFVPEILQSVVTELCEGLNATHCFNTKIVDSGIEALHVIRISIEAFNATQDIHTEISEGHNNAQHIQSKTVDSGIEALQVIRSSICGINTGQVHVTEIFAGLAKALHLLSSMSAGINAAQYLPDEMMAYTAFAQHIKHMLSLTPIKSIKPAWDITLDGVSIKKYIKDVTLTKSESDAVNHLEIQIAGLSLFDKCNPTDGYGTERITLTIGRDTYKFFIESREISETYDKAGLILWGRQKSGLLAEGYAQKITQTYSDIFASTLAAAIAANCGVSLSWEASDYWIKSFSADAYPIDAIIQLAAATGAIVQTNPDGSAVVRPKYPVIPSMLSTASAAVVFDRDNVIGLDLSEEQPLYSKVTVNIKQDNAASYDFSSAVDQSCVKPGGVATIKIYKPNDNVKYGLIATPTGKIKKTATGTVEPLTETITLTNGTGSTVKAIYNVVSYQLYSCDSAHNEIKYIAGSKEITVDNDTCAVCVITYETHYDTWELSCDIEREIVVCLVTYKDNGMPSSVTVIMGKGSRAAADITNDLIYGENQAKIVAETYLDDNYYRKRKYQLDVPYIGCQTGQIASIADDRHNVYGVGIIRDASLSIKLSGAAAVIKEKIELYCYEEDGLI
ncbi:MAG: hypothetical protein HQK97_09200 [Nitrospirae bacterium]|nr:hypothetical protein [Nitrospirota bacterium]